MKTEVLVPKREFENLDTRAGYTDTKQLFKKLNSIERSKYCTSALLEFMDNPELEKNDYLKGVNIALNDEMTNLTENGIYVQVCD